MVEWKKLGEVASVSNGERPISEILETGLYPYINAGRTNSGFLNECNSKGKAVTTPSHGEGGIGSVLYQEHDFWCGALCYKIYTHDDVKSRYLFHYLCNNSELIISCKNVGGQPYINRKQLERLVIAVPSLSEQERIVGILDTFTSSIKNLKAQISLRRKQYEHYRDKLLDLEGKPGVEIKTLGEVFEMRGGYTPSTSNIQFWEGGTIPWFKMDDIRERGRILNDSNLHITPAAVKGKGLFKANSIILATSATIGEHALITAEHLCNQRFTNFYPKKEYKGKIDMKFFYYYMFIVDKWCKQNILQGSFASVDGVGLKNLSIPIPSLQEQSRIVSILDEFEASIKNLEAQLKEREKQYEYYRNKLLMFE